MNVRAGEVHYCSSEDKQWEWTNILKRPKEEGLGVRTQGSRGCQEWSLPFLITHLFAVVMLPLPNSHQSACFNKVFFFFLLFTNESSVVLCLIPFAKYYLIKLLSMDYSLPRCPCYLTFHLFPSGIYLGHRLDFLKREDVILLFFLRALSESQEIWVLVLVLSTICYFKSPNISGMLAPCAWKERVGLDDPFLILHPVPSLLAPFVLIGSEERRKLLVCPVALIRLSLPGGKSVFIGKVGASKVSFHSDLPLLGIAPETMDGSLYPG